MPAWADARGAMGTGVGQRGACAPCCLTPAAIATVPRLPSSKLSLIRSVVTMAMAVIRVGMTQVSARLN